MNGTANALLTACLQLIAQAGQKILTLYEQQDQVKVHLKSDESPVTQADLQAHECLVQGLQYITPEIPVLSEESKQQSYQDRRRWREYWLVDPLDGTKEFIHKTDEFTVNVAYIKDGRAEMGVIYAPRYDCYYYAQRGNGCYKQINNQSPESIHTRPMPDTGCIALMSRRHQARKAIDFLAMLPHCTRVNKGSSLKTCLIAEGQADFYPSFGHTSEWDMGAAQCIIEEAGGAMLDLTGHSIRFNQRQSLLNPPLLIVGDPSFPWNHYLPT